MRQLLLAFLVVSITPSLNAQWRVALLHGTAASHGDARADADPAHPELQAHRPATWAVSLSRATGRWRLGIDLHRTTADLAEVGPSSSVSTKSVLTAWGTAIEFARRVAGQAGTAELFAGGGASLDRWTFDLTDDSPRTRAAARGVIEADFPIGGGWSATVRGEAAVGPSVFKLDELPDGFTPRTATRVGIVLGVARRW